MKESAPQTMRSFASYAFKMARMKMRAPPRQTPVSITAGVQLAAELGHFVVGCEAQFLPVHTTKQTSYAPSAETKDETFYPVPVGLFVGAAF